MPEGLILSQTSAFRLPPPFWNHGPIYASSPCLKWYPTAGASPFWIISPVLFGNRLLTSPTHSQQFWTRFLVLLILELYLLLQIKSVWMSNIIWYWWWHQNRERFGVYSTTGKEISEAYVVFRYISTSRYPVCSIVQELCESRGGRPGLSVLTSLLVSVDVKIYWTVLRHWSQLVPNMSTDIWGH